MGVNPFPRSFRFMPHNSINTHLVCPGRIKAASECVAALMRGMLHFQLPHDFSPQCPVLGLIQLLPVVLKQIAAFGLFNPLLNYDIIEM